jgi:outer membrane protein assembly factor BamE (lipoprotein component of BamABCDE complex)
MAARNMWKYKPTRRVSLAVAACVLPMFMAIWLLTHSQIPHPEAFRQIRVGMNQTEVESLLGRRPGNYGLYAWGIGFCTREAFLAPPGSVEKTWRDDTHEFNVWFDKGGRVTAAAQRAGYEQGPPHSFRELFDCLRKCFGF